MSDSSSIEETIFFGAREFSRPEERAAYLDQKCAGDPALRERVERMLKAEQKADQFLASDPLRVDKTAPLAIEGNDAVGSTVGPYKLLQQIGEGGCGIVYMAEQEQPIRRRVALKVIKPGMDSRQVIARFEAERQALALMDHPNIARVLDAGTTGTGRPYFVMELVRGIRITEYCDQNNLSTRERLDLFAKVVHAVQHAHQKGIIHRDIKPSNVLVTLNDGVPVPKMIDFGIAKALEQKLTDKTLFTRFEMFIGTPAYSSPEQAEMGSLDIDTRSDIYSLGVLLYELLVGQTPFDAQDLVRSGLDEMRRIIREKEPARPSTRLSTMLQGEVTTTAQRRRVSAPELVHLLKGDLDWIVMKCLEKDRTRRYDTANGLADDLQHYLSNEPVTARPASQVYRLGKLVRRNRLAFAAGAAVIVALVAGIAVSTWQAVRAHRAEQAAQLERDSAEAVLNYFRNNILAAGRPQGQQGGLGKDVTLRQAIDAAEAGIATSLGNRPVVEAAIRHTLGASYLYLGEPGLAIQQLERALALRREIFGVLHKSTIGALDILQDAYKAAGKPDQGLPFYEEILKLRKARLGDEHDDTLSAMNNLGLKYLEARKHAQAMPLLEETLRLRKARLGPTHESTLVTMNNLALVYLDTGKLNEAATLLEEILHLMKAILGADHVQTLNTMQNLSVAYGWLGRHEQRLMLSQEVFALIKFKRGREHPDTIKQMSELANATQIAGKHDEALRLYEEALTLSKARLGPEHPDTLWTASGLGGTYLRAGRYDQALPLLQETFQIQKAKLGPSRSATLRTMSDLAVATEHAAPGKLDEALPLYEEVFKLMTKKTDHRATLNGMNALGAAYSAAGKLEQAEALYREWLRQKGDGLSATFGLARVLVERASTDTTNSARSQERVTESLQLVRDGLAQTRIRYTNDPASLEKNLGEGADIFSQHDRYAEAEPLYREILRNQRSRLGAVHRDVIHTMTRLGGLLADWAWAERDSKSEVRNPKSEIVVRAREAERLLRECLALRLRNTAATSWRVEDTKSRLGGALVSVAVIDPELNAVAREAKLAEAETLLLESSQRLQDSQSAGKKYKRDALERLVRLYEAWGKPAQLSEAQQKLEVFNKARAASSTPAAQAGP